MKEPVQLVHAHRTGPDEDPPIIGDHEVELVTGLGLEELPDALGIVICPLLVIVAVGIAPYLKTRFLT